MQCICTYNIEAHVEYIIVVGVYAKTALRSCVFVKTFFFFFSFLAYGIIFLSHELTFDKDLSVF